ncbi:MAG: 16S rRNA (guanine(966)-N(2))-methyltransferase RsmD [Thermodesulfobacteriota bacterium]
MRIISGHARGRKLTTPGRTKGIRPTSDRAREALFSIIGSRVLSARVLDLFAGTGALGLEAFSRGAALVVFVDNSHKAIDIIKRNCLTCMQGMDVPSGDEPLLLKHDLRRGLNLKLADHGVTAPFDLIFLDPPYGCGLAESSLQRLDRSDLYVENSLVIVEEESGAELPETFTNLVLVDQRRYGDTGFWFYKVKEK